MRGEITFKILDNIAGFIGDAGDFIDAFLNTGYGSSSAERKKYINQLRGNREKFYASKKTEEEEIQKMHNIICKLKKHGFIAFNIKSKKKAWSLTPNGYDKLRKLESQISNGILPSIIYPKEKGHQLIIVAFDIPEIERRKRDWFRTVLGFLEFKPLQKSIMVGKIKIPDELLEDIKDLRITDFIEIFSINKFGSLKQII